MEAQLAAVARNATADARNAAEEVVKEAKNLSEMVVPTVLEKHRSLQNMCAPEAWLTLPQMDWPTLIASQNALHPVNTNATLLGPMEEAWSVRHHGQKAVPRDDRVAPVRYSPCRLGVCVCKGEFHPRLLQRMVKFLRQHEQKDLLGGHLVLCWEGFEVAAGELFTNQAFVKEMGWSKRDVDARKLAVRESVNVVGAGESMRKIYVHISLCQLRPFRATFVEIEVLEGQDWCFQAKCDQGVPLLQTMYQFLHKLRPDWAWDITSHRLSERMSLLPCIDGRVALVPVPLFAERVWLADWERQAAVRRRAPQQAAAAAAAAAPAAGAGDDEPVLAGQNDEIEQEPKTWNTPV